MRTLLVGILLMTSVHTLLGQDAVVCTPYQGGNRLVFHPSAPVLVTHDGHHLIQAEQMKPNLEVGNPEVLHYTTKLIADDSKAMSLSLGHAVYHDVQNVDLLPSKGNLLRNQDPATVPYTYGSAYTTDAFYPGSLSKLGEPFVQQHFRGQAMQLFPYQYNPVTKTLRVYDEIELFYHATEQQGTNILPTSVPRMDKQDEQEYRRQFINYADHQDRYTAVDELGNMLVITHGNYLDEIANWVQWKIEKGIDVRVLDVANVPTVAAISDYISTMYNDPNSNLNYVVLVGDETQVPSELVTNVNGTGYCDNCYGYISGADHYSEVFVGRFLVHNETELVPMLAKVMEYEKTPYLGTDWFSKAMGIGSDQGTGIGDDGQADWQHQNGLKQDLLNFTYTEVFERYDGNHNAASPTGGTTADGTGSPASSELSNVINAGVSLINYTGHGDHNLIVTGNFTNAQINQLSNYHMYPYFIIVGCCVGDFDDDSGTGDTFGEAWVKSPTPSTPTGGIGGAFSSVFQSWAPPMEGQDEMNAIITEMSTTATPTRHTLGSIHINGCAGMNDVYGTDGNDMTDTWILMGDPSIQLRTAFPSNIEAQHDVSAFLGSTSFTVTSTSENAMVCLSQGNTIIATGIIVGGICVLSFSPLSVPGTMLVTLTNFNTVPYQQEVNIIPATGPYVVAVTHSNLDGNGLNASNNQVDFNETISLSLDLSNVGISDATGCTVTISTTSPYVTIIDNTENAGDILMGLNSAVTNGFGYTVSSSVPDMTTVTFTVTITDNNGNTWTSFFTETIFAPVLECGTWTVVDSNGNNNGRLDSGESAEIHYTVFNSGHSIANVVEVNASENSNDADITSPNQILTTVAPQAYLNVVLPVQVIANAANGVTWSIDLAFTNPEIQFNCNMAPVINQIIETWENGGETQFNWNYEGNADWFITTNMPYAGVNCMQSGAINNSQTTTLIMTSNFTQAGDVQFMYKTSTESGYDYLYYNVDNVNIASWSGENAWTSYTSSLTAGTHTLRWKYTKDNIFSSGSDAAWVDDIVMPPNSTSYIFEEDASPMNVSLFPNPSDGHCTVTLHLPTAQRVTIHVLNAVGQRVNSFSQLPVNAGENTLHLSNEKLASGLYTLQIIGDSGTITKGFIVR